MTPWEHSPQFFAYGTLLHLTGHAAVDEVLSRARKVAEGFIPGWLLDLGPYPGALPLEAFLGDRPTEGVIPRIRGAVLELSQPLRDGPILG
jgi:hypothetical protein